MKFTVRPELLDKDAPGISIEGPAIVTLYPNVEHQEPAVPTKRTRGVSREEN